MSNIVPIVISGQLDVKQPCIIMSVVDNTPYYLVTDSAGVPFFQPLYFDINLGLDVFQRYATRVTIALAGGGSTTYGRSTLITNIVAGQFLADFSINRVIAPASLSTAYPTLPLEPTDYLDPLLVACGYQYTFDKGLQFFLTQTWYPNPNIQAIGSISTGSTASFFVFPVRGVVDSDKKPADAIVFSTIYNDVIGQKALTFLFSSEAAWEVGAGEPYQYCAVQQCQADCYGLCDNSYAGCHRQSDGKFACVVTASPSCKVIFSLPFLTVAIISLIAFFVLLFHVRAHRKEAGKPSTGSLAYAMPMHVKVWLIVLMIIPTAICILLFVLVTIDTQNVDTAIRRICPVSAAGAL